MPPRPSPNARAGRDAAPHAGRSAASRSASPRSTATASCPASCTSPSGRRRRRSARAGRCATDDVITSTHRGHGHCLAKGLDPLGDVRRADGSRPGDEPRPGRLHAHRRPGPGIFGANGIVAAGLPIATGAATAAQLRDDGTCRRRVLRRRRGRAGCVPRGAQPGRRLAPAGRSSSARTTATRSSPPPRPSTRRRLERRAAGYAIALRGRRRQRRRWPLRRSCGTPSWPPDRRAARPSSRRRTYRWHGHYEGDPQRYRSRRRCGSGRRATRSSRHRERLVGAGVGEAEHRPARVRRGGRARPRPSKQARALPAPSAGVTLRLRRPAPAVGRARRAAAAARRRRRDLPHHGRRPRRPRVRAGRRRARLPRRRRRRRAAATSSA